MDQSGSYSQATLFDGDFSAVREDVGYRGPVACSVAGITYRQLDYWARTGLVLPQVRAAEGSGTQRLYSFRDILLLKVIKNLIDAGISLQHIRMAIDHLRSRGDVDLTAITLMSDGTSVFECTEDNEIIDLVKGGQAMFAIDLSGVWHDIEGTLVQLPTSEADEVWTDELSQRRRLRRVA
ncbi:MAG: MerR family transcriptional regulator [Propionibacteriaceae bacterium]|jgi:DNA-binding transcriptional MerR regulator|nr:MerR family transcriptional regulator [Propionibacteriaceae bacterium]